MMNLVPLEPIDMVFTCVREYHRPHHECSIEWIEFYAGGYMCQFKQWHDMRGDKILFNHQGVTIGSITPLSLPDAMERFPYMADLLLSKMERHNGN